VPASARVWSVWRPQHGQAHWPQASGTWKRRWRPACSGRRSTPKRLAAANKDPRRLRRPLKRRDGDRPTLPGSSLGCPVQRGAGRAKRTGGWRRCSDDRSAGSRPPPACIDGWHCRRRPWSRPKASLLRAYLTASGSLPLKVWITKPLATVSANVVLLRATLTGASSTLGQVRCVCAA
jgi:hypothetical protein